MMKDSASLNCLSGVLWIVSPSLFMKQISKPSTTALTCGFDLISLMPPVQWLVLQAMPVVMIR
jgi:hypothetical protein